MEHDFEALAAISVPLRPDGFNASAHIPYGCSVEMLKQSMQSFIDFLALINQGLSSHHMPRLETLLMPANFSSIVSEYLCVTLPKQCPSLVKNGWHNGHPDLLPKDRYPQNAAQHASEGIEVKASRYIKGWQGHNAETSWLMVFVFDSNRPRDSDQHLPSRPFRFLKVLGAQLTQADWKFSGRSETSRRTITASITATGYAKMEANWLYHDLTVPDAIIEKAGEDDPDSHFG